MQEAPGIVAVVAAARRKIGERPTAGDATLLGTAHIRSLRGGHRNPAFAFSHRARTYCLKFHSDATTAQREWHVLQFLTRRGSTAHPAPVLYDADESPHAVVMEYVRGENMSGQNLTEAQQASLHRLLASLWQIAPEGAAVPPIRIGPMDWLVRVRDEADKMSANSGTAATNEGYNLLRGCLAGPDTAVLALPAAPVFSQGDANLSNYLWDGDAVRPVDFENGGWSDRAFDLADLVEHVQSRGTPDTVWAAFVRRFALSEGEQVRHIAARRLLAFSWLVKCWPEPASESSGEYAERVARVRALCARTD